MQFHWQRRTQWNNKLDLNNFIENIILPETIYSNWMCDERQFEKKRKQKKKIENWTKSIILNKMFDKRCNRIAFAIVANLFFTNDLPISFFVNDYVTKCYKLSVISVIY